MNNGGGFICLDDEAYKVEIEKLKEKASINRVHSEVIGWIKCSERLPEPETPVLVMNNGVIRIGEIRWDHPTHEENHQAFKYWDDPHDDGQPWEVFDITHWMPLPEPPSE